MHTTPDHGIFFRHRNQPMVISFHNYVLDPFMRQYSSWAQRLHYSTDLRWSTRWTLRQASAVTAVSRFTASLVQKDLGWARSPTVIYNGVDLNAFHPGRSRQVSNEVRVFFAGNLTLRKGITWLHPIARRLRPNITLYYTAGLRTPDRLRTKWNVVAIGKIPPADMPARYREMDILLLPTVREGFSMSVLEAMACGLPVVASNCSSLPEQIEEGRGGFLCPIGDVQAFADRINLLASSPALRRAMGGYNRDRVEREFTIDRMVMGYRSVFQQVIANHDPR